MNNPSSRHHFIPEFFLRNFTNPEGKFYIYSVKKREFKGNGKLYTPRSHFFRSHGNSTEIQPVAPDYLESRHYSPLDSDISKIITKIKNSTDLRRDLTSLECVKVNYFINHLFWRNPTTDDLAKNLLANSRAKDLGINFIGDKENLKKFEEFIKSHKDFYKVIKSMLPLNMHHLAFEAKNNFEILTLPKLHGGVLLGDNPVVLRKKEMIDTYCEDLIVPLTANIFFVRSKLAAVYFDEYLKVRLDLLQLKQANEYVCVTDRGYLERLMNLYDKHMLDEKTLRDELFSKLDQGVLP